MQLLGIDIGSSSVKCALLRAGKLSGKIVHAPFRSLTTGVRVEVEPTAILKAVQSAVRDSDGAAKRADAIALSVFSPGWVAMDGAGEPLTPIITHQDRRSVEVAIALERKVGADRYLNLAGTRPFPGGISSTTWAWYLKHEPSRLRRADLVGHLNTYLHRTLTGARVVDPANASFMGVYSTFNLSGWNDELCDAAGAKASQLPEVRGANQIGGKLTRQAANRLGLAEGLPMLVGVVDGSAAMLLAGARPGQLLNVCGSTDVLALCTNRFSPHQRLLTRALGVGKLWLSVSTIAAAGSAIAWVKDQFFGDLGWPDFQKRVVRLAGRGDRSASRSRKSDASDKPAGTVRFDPYLAGDRMSIEQRQAAFTGLTLASTRDQMLAAVLEALAQASVRRLELLEQIGMRIRREVVVTGGAEKLGAVFHRDWPGRWSFESRTEASLRGLWRLVTGE